MNATSAPASLLRRALVVVAVVGVPAALAVLGAAWLLGTTAGARFALERLAARAGGSVAGVEGRLAGPLAVAAVAVDTGALRLRAGRVALDWSPAQLLRGEVRIGRLHAETVELAFAPGGEPARAPASLVPPVALRVGDASVGRLRLGKAGAESGGTELREVALRLAADRGAWQVTRAEAVTPIGRVKLAATLGAAAPFPLELKGEVAGERQANAYRATLAATGTLARIDASLAAAEGGLAGRAQAVIEPLAAQPVRSLVANLDGVDLAAFAAAPRTRLAVVADLAPRDDAALAGTIRLVNADPGPLDRQRLPVTAAEATLVLGGDRVEVTRAALRMAGGGHAQGRAAWSGGRLDARFTVRDGDLLAWHSSLRPTRLAGDIVATVTGETQSFEVALAEPRFEVRAAARIAGGRLVVERARLARGAAFVEAAGEMALSGARAFQAQGRIVKLDPAAFARVSPGELNATFDVKGHAGKPVSGELALAIGRSRFAGLQAEGRVEATMAEGELRGGEVDVSVGNVRLVGKGALGRPEDRLRVRLESPDLAPVGRALGAELAGRVDLDAQLAGALSGLSGRVRLAASDLRLPGALRVAAATATVELGAGEAGMAVGNIALRGLRRGTADTTVDSVLATLKGTRAAHEIRLDAELQDRLRVQAFLDGGVVAGERLPEWRGRLESLQLSGPTDFALVAPAPLVAGAERIELGEAALSGEPGSVRLARTRWTPGALETRGSSNAVVIRTVRRLLKLEGDVGSDLVLAGEWDVRVGESLDGFVRVQRERGDVRLGEPRQALGLEDLRLQAEVAGGRLRATVDIRGRQAGRWSGELAGTLARGEGGWSLSPVAPLAGRFTVDVPDLAWTAAWLGPEARVAGRLTGSGGLAGTVRDPSWTGRLEATGLSLRDPALGAEVAEGTVAIAFVNREARIERFALSTPWRPGGEAARAIAAATRPPVGTVTAEGAYDLGTRKGAVRLQAVSFPLTRLDTRFLAVSGEGRAQFDGAQTALAGQFRADAGWFGIPAAAPPSLSDDVIVDRGLPTPPAAREAGRTRLDLRVDLGEHLHFHGRGLTTRLAGSLRLAGDLGANLRTTGTIRAVGGTYDAYGRKLTIERGALNFHGPVDNPGLNILALRKGLPVEAGVEIGGNVARPKPRLVSLPDVPDSEKLAWLVLGRGKGDVNAADAATLIAAADDIFGREVLPAARVLRGLALDEISVGSEESGVLGAMPQSTVAGRTGTSSTAEVVTVGKQLTENIRVSYQQGFADAEGSLRIALQFSKSLQFILRAGYHEGIDAAYRFNWR